ncbi:MAG: dTDP-4-dehydrorhamnose reductase [Alloprevotella sp.]
MNILVTGANGQLGHELRMASRAAADTYFFTDVCTGDGNDTLYLDITDAQAVGNIVSSRGIDAIVNCAAFTNVDAAETNEALAEKLNAQAPEILARVMAETGGLLIHISTDYVFGAEPYNRPCREDQQGTPTGVYGLTKLHGEQRIVEAGCDYLIFRTAWLYSAFGKNFVKTMLALMQSRERLNVVFDQCGTPTYAADLAAAIVHILSSRKYEGHTGIYHYSNEGVTSWYDFAKMIADIHGNISCNILPCHSSEFPSPVVRPSYSVLDKTKFKTTFGLDVPYWVDSLRRCMQVLAAS